MDDQNPLLDTPFFKNAPQQKDQGDEDNPLLSTPFFSGQKPQDQPQQAQTQPSQDEGGPWMNVPRGAPLSEVAKGTAVNLIPSTGKAAAGVASAVMHPIDTGYGMYQLYKGIRSKVDAAAGKEQDPKQKAEDEAPLNALMSVYGDRYGSIQGIEHAMANDPASVLMDLSAVLGGGELAATKALGEGSSVAGALGKASELTNPLAPVAKAAEKIIPSPSSVKNPIVDKSGNFTSNADQTIRAASNGKLGAADFIDSSDPSIQAAALNIFNNKGISPATVAEAAGATSGFQIPRSILTGETPSVGGAEAVRGAMAASEPSFGSLARGITGTQGADTTALAGALEQAHLDKMAEANAAYAKLGQNKAILPSINYKDFMPEIQKSLATNPMNQTSIAEMQLLPNKNYQSIQAMKKIDDLFGGTNPQTAYGLTTPQLESIRQELNSHLNLASGVDAATMHDIIEGYDNAVQNAAQQNKFRSTDPSLPHAQASQNVYSDMNNARSTWRNMKQTFEGSSTPEVNSAVRSMSNNYGPNNTSGGFASHQNAQPALSKALMDPNRGALAYNNMIDAVGGQGSAGAEAINNHYRQELLGTDNNGVLKMNPEKLDAHISNPNSVFNQGYAFTPSEKSAIRRMNAARIAMKRKIQGPSLGKTITSATAKTAARTIAPFAGHYLLGPAGPFAAQAFEQGIEHVPSYMARKREMAGAPTNWRNKLPLRAARSAVNLGNRPLAAEMLRTANQTGAYASGGKIGMSAKGKAGHLISMVDQVRKDEGKATSTLLNLDDTTVAKALAIANKQI
jgi:hypothetical protein